MTENRIEKLRSTVDELTDTDSRGELRFVMQHMYGVSVFAAMLAVKRNLNPEIAAMIGLLHDIHTATTGNPYKHAKQGSVKAREILEELKITTEEETEIICNAIRSHSKKETEHDEYSELIKDADVLDHYFYNTTLPPMEKDKVRLEKLLLELRENIHKQHDVWYNLQNGFPNRFGVFLAMEKVG